MSCASREQSIALYVEGDLKESERREVESHLQGCSSCRELAKFIDIELVSLQRPATGNASAVGAFRSSTSGIERSR
jgi:anti-sigma factor RsiW